jgi:flagellar protein FliS
MSASIDAYRTTDLGTAGPRQIIIRALDTAVRHLDDAAARIAEGASAEEPLSKARTIVGGLMTSLDLNAGDVARRMLSLYVFVLDRILRSRASSSDVGIGDAARVLRTLQSAWEEMPAAEAKRGLEAKRDSGLRVRG